jgi:hypothetical protein
MPQVGSSSLLSVLGGASQNQKLALMAAIVGAVRSLVDIQVIWPLAVVWTRLGTPSSSYGWGLAMTLGSESAPP